MTDERPIVIDAKGAAWAYTLGFQYPDDGCPFLVGTPHQCVWQLGASTVRMWPEWVRL